VPLGFEKLPSDANPGFMRFPTTER